MINSFVSRHENMAFTQTNEVTFCKIIINTNKESISADIKL
jgi:hypothetical protein